MCSMSWSLKTAARHGTLFQTIALLGLLLTLFFANEQVGSLFGKHTPAAGSRSRHTGYYLIDCAHDMEWLGIR